MHSDKEAGAQFSVGLNDHEFYSVLLQHHQKNRFYSNCSLLGFFLYRLVVMFHWFTFVFVFDDLMLLFRRINAEFQPLPVGSLDEMVCVQWFETVALRDLRF